MVTALAENAVILKDLRHSPAEAILAIARVAKILLFTQTKHGLLIGLLNSN